MSLLLEAEIEYLPEVQIWLELDFESDLKRAFVGTAGIEAVARLDFGFRPEHFPTIR